MSLITSAQAQPRQPSSGLPPLTALAASADALVYTGNGQIVDKTGAPRPVQNASSLRQYDDGVYLNGRGDGDPNRLGRWNVGKQPASAVAACMVVRLQRSAVAYNGYVFAWGDTGTATRCHVSISTTALNVSVRQAQFDTPRVETYALTAMQKATWAIRCVAGVGIEVFKDGALQSPTSSSGSMPSSSLFTSTGQVVWLGSNDEYSAFGGHYGSALWFRDLGSDAVRWLSEDMYSGLYGPLRVVLPTPQAAPPASFKPAWARNSNSIIRGMP